VAPDPYEACDSAERIAFQASVDSAEENPNSTTFAGFSVKPMQLFFGNPRTADDRAVDPVPHRVF
jgi:hypothetical protein